ncbi:MAG: DeoR/GlpR transcriptional regulator [Clostridia bacterium]|nr:DeoR/GlpR transcriptional regulator [Clostridia bacterium]
MYQQERMDQIIKILKENHYVTVDYLVEKIRYSPASIRRDLTLLEKQGMVKRSYGGVALGNAGLSPFRFRQHNMKTAKNAIAKKAATLVKDNDVVFLDGSSTTQYMGHFLIDKKDITVVTCNIILADFLSEHGINTFCTGGKIVEYPGILGGQFMLDSLDNYDIDIGFFSTLSVSLDGKLITNSEAGLHAYRVFREKAKKLVCLCGSDKFNLDGRFVSMTLEQVDYFVSDGNLPNDVKQKYPNTQFLCTK